MRTGLRRTKILPVETPFATFGVVLLFLQYMIRRYKSFPSTDAPIGQGQQDHKAEHRTTPVHAANSDWELGWERHEDAHVHAPSDGVEIYQQAENVTEWFRQPATHAEWPVIDLAASELVNKEEEDGESVRSVQRKRRERGDTAESCG